MRTQRININFPDAVARELKEVVPEGERSKVVSEATRKELQRIKRKGAFAELVKLRKTTRKLAPGEIARTLQHARRSSP